MFTIWDNGTWKTTAVGGLKLAAGLIVALIALLQGGDTVAHLVAVLAALQGIGGFISGLVQKDANPSPAPSLAKAAAMVLVCVAVGLAGCLHGCATSGLTKTITTTDPATGIVTVVTQLDPAAIAAYNTIFVSDVAQAEQLWNQYTTQRATALAARNTANEAAETVKLQAIASTITTVAESFTRSVEK